MLIHNNSNFIIDWRPMGLFLAFNFNLYIKKEMCCHFSLSFNLYKIFIKMSRWNRWVLDSKTNIASEVLHELADNYNNIIC